MPTLNLSLSVSLEGVATAPFFSQATTAVTKIMGIPESYLMIVLKGSVPISIGGTQQPAAFGELVSVGGLNPSVNKKLSAALADLLESKFSIPKSHFNLKFYDSKGSFYGWNGSTL